MLHVGSTWSKWDLHIHTPFSIIQNYGGPTPENLSKFLDDLENLPPHFRVIGINDYYSVAGYQFVYEQKYKHGRLRNIELVLPVIEVRLNRFAGVVNPDKASHALSRINLHVIFDQIQPDQLNTHFLTALERSYDLSPDYLGVGKIAWKDISTPETLAELGRKIKATAPPEELASMPSDLKVGFNNICFDLEEMRKVLSRDTLRDRHLIAVGKTEWSDIKWSASGAAEKKHLINQAAMVFVAAQNPTAYDKARNSLKSQKVNDRLLDCSDAHNYSGTVEKDAIGNCFTWIKAEPTFAGLKHAIAEFDQRVFVGDDPPKRILVRNSSPKYISHLRIEQEPGNPSVDKWFDVSIPLNHDLVAIIGNKGSGKSALADTIALIGDTRNFAYFSFLTKNRFCNPRSNYAKYFRGTLHWKDNRSSEKTLDSDVNFSVPERVKYLPQSFIDALCNEISSGETGRFDAELRKIIFTHVPEELKFEHKTLDELLEFKLSNSRSELDQMRSRLSALNQLIVDIERKLTFEHRAALVGNLSELQRQRQAALAAKPEEVQNPQESDDVRQITVGLRDQISAAEVEIEKLIDEEQLLRAERGELLRRNAISTKIIEMMRSEERRVSEFKIGIQSMLRDANIAEDVNEIFSIKIDLKSVLTMASNTSVDAQRIGQIIDDESESGLKRKIADLTQSLEQLKGQLGEPQRLYMNYQTNLRIWQESLANIDGNIATPGTIAFYENELKLLESLPSDFEIRSNERLDLMRGIHSHLIKMTEQYRDLYGPVQSFVKQQEDLGFKIELDFNVKVVEKEFLSNFTEMLNRQARGSFYGVQESNAVIENAVKATDFNEVDSVSKFVEEINRKLHVDERGDKPVHMNPTDQLRKNVSISMVYDYLYGLNYLDPEYSLTYAGQELGLLSPGERGLLLLVFYLLVDRNDVPLVIDQPEENLDNQTIFKVLVHCIKLAKQRRQVIMVTHNPNLAVVCDAEQIICASKNRGVNQFEYISGPIETAIIKDRIVEILEGTQPAFDNRRDKYLFK